jgi:hypothetical protein
MNMKKVLTLALLCLVPFINTPQTDTTNMDDFDGCGLEGTAKTASLKALNLNKNRYAIPQANEINGSITLQSMLNPGDDKTRWNSTAAAEISGYVFDIKPGGPETCNCGKTDSLHTDVHIELVSDPADSGPTRRVIVEVTPRIRAIMATSGITWTVTTLRTQYLHKRITVRGWMTFDAQHANAAENTNPSGASNWRATAWEIHPVMSIKAVPAP